MNDNIIKIKLDKAIMFTNPNDPNTKAMLENGPGGRPLSEPYIVWETVPDRNRPRLIHNKLHGGGGNFEVIVEELAFNVTHSKPTGRDNDVVILNENNYGAHNFLIKN